jgi:hypothetical protein
VFRDRTADLPAEAPIAVIGELPHSFGKGGLDLRADMNEVC